MARITDTKQFQNKQFFFRVQKWGWRVVGFWPGLGNVPKPRIVLSVANSIEILVYSVFQLMYCYESADNLTLLLDALTPVLTQITTAIKVLFIVARRDDIKFVLDYLKESFYKGKFKHDRNFKNNETRSSIQISHFKVSKYMAKRQLFRLLLDWLFASSQTWQIYFFV